MIPGFLIAWSDARTLCMNSRCFSSSVRCVPCTSTCQPCTSIFVYLITFLGFGFSIWGFCFRCSLEFRFEGLGFRSEDFPFKGTGTRFYEGLNCEMAWAEKITSEMHFHFASERQAVKHCHHGMISCVSFISNWWIYVHSGGRLWEALGFNHFLVANCSIFMSTHYPRRVGHLWLAAS